MQPTIVGPSDRCTRGMPVLRAYLEAVHLQASLVIDVHIFLLGSRKELLIVQELDVPHSLFHLDSQATGQSACTACTWIYSEPIHVGKSMLELCSLPSRWKQHIDIVAKCN